MPTQEPRKTTQENEGKSSLGNPRKHAQAMKQKQMKNQCARASDLPVPVLELPNPEPVPNPELWLVCPNPVPPPPKKDMVSLGVEDLFLHREELTTNGENVRDEIDAATKANGWWRVVEEEERREGGRRARKADSKVRSVQVCQVRQACLPQHGCVWSVT